MTAEPLVGFAVFVLGVATQHLLWLELDVGIAGQLVVHLLGVVTTQEFDVLLALPPQDGADRCDGGIHHVLHQVMALDEKIGVLLVNP